MKSGTKSRTPSKSEFRPHSELDELDICCILLMEEWQWRSRGMGDHTLISPKGRPFAECTFHGTYYHLRLEDGVCYQIPLNLLTLGDLCHLSAGCVPEGAQACDPNALERALYWFLTPWPMYPLGDPAAEQLKRKLLAAGWGAPSTANCLSMGSLWGPGRTMLDFYPGVLDMMAADGSCLRFLIRDNLTEANMERIASGKLPIIRARDRIK